MSPSLTKKGRRLSLDAYRGFTMLFMASGGFGLHVLRDNGGLLSRLAHQVEHVPWQGCTMWDLIMPSFIFIVGVAMPFAFAVRRERGQSRALMFKHVVQRVLTLLFIGMALVCIHHDAVYISFITVLQQIAIAYFFAFFVLGRGLRTQAVTAVGILLAHWALFVLWPGAGPFGPWAKNVNFAAALDLWWSGSYNPGGYTSFNAFSSTATVIFGIMAGELLRKDIREKSKVLYLIAAGVVFLALGMFLNPVLPVVKRIWTASWTLYSTGWALLLLAFFYWMIEVMNRRKWCFIFMVVGMNSITIYIISQLLSGTFRDWSWVFTRPFLSPLGDAGIIIQALIVVSMKWYTVYWLYKHKIFLKVG
ncbi:MAG: DUF5009 domain-containing protein [Gemmatimonadota bacterium]|nr:DUF5009 domain-containing protein [Gemmatimonadota bacterium]